MPAVLRTCRRTGCRWPADASLSFRYTTREVWLEGLPEEPDPAAYDLCPHHAEALTVPRGWDFTDRRPAASVPPREPAGRELPGAASAAGASGEERRDDESCAVPNRYAALSAALPRLAAEHAAGGPKPPGARAEGRGPSADDPQPVLPEVEGQLAIPVSAEHAHSVD